MTFRSVAVDLEFIKRGGHPYMRSIALVPFTRRAAAAAGPPDSQLPQEPLYHTCFHSPSTVLTLNTDAVMRQAELLPCGHVLRDYIARTKLAAPALTAMKEKYTHEAETQLAAYRALRRELRAAQKSFTKRKGVKEEPEAEAEMLNEEDGDDDVGETGPVDVALGPAEKALSRELQVRCGIARHFDALDPHSIPNLRQLQQLEGAFRALYTAPPDSNELTRASARLSPLRRYGKGKGPQKALCFLFRYYPSFIQEVLRATFRNEGEWLAWLEEAARLTEEELRATNAHHQQLAAEGGCVYKEFESLEALGKSTRQAWATYQQSRAHHVKFYCYGTVDSSVLYRTLLLGDQPSQQKEESQQQQQQEQQHGPPRQGRFSPRGLAAGHGAGRMPRVTAVTTPTAVLPHEARLVDVTRHPVFTVSGFKKGKKVPSLSAALEKTARRDETARELLLLARMHDPLWDAQALACVGAAAGLC